MHVHEVQYVRVWEGGGGKDRGEHAIRRRNRYVCVEIKGYSVAYFDCLALPRLKHCVAKFPLWVGLIHAL